MGEYCIHVANIFYLVSFVNRDMMWLRILTCLGLSFGVVFFTTCPTPMYGPTVWHVVFLVINAYQIYRLIIERRETNLDPNQELIGEVALEGMEREDLVCLLAQELGGSLDKRKTPEESAQATLEESELVLKQLVLDRLSRKELVNLLTRRMWKPLKRRFKRKKRLHEIRDPDLQEKAELIDDTLVDSKAAKINCL